MPVGMGKTGSRLDLVVDGAKLICAFDERTDLDLVGGGGEGD